MLFEKQIIPLLMITRTLLLLSFITLCFLAQGQQQIVNGSFENWENSGKQIEPVGWNSLMSADLCTFCSIGASQRIFIEKHGFNGLGSSLRIESTSALGVVVNGNITTGRVTAPSLIPSGGYNRTVLSDPEFQLPFDDKPDSLVFWAKYSITDESDSAIVSFLLHDNFEQTDPPRSKGNLQPSGKAQLVFQTGFKWQRISIPFKYLNRTENNPAYLLATFSSSFESGKGNSDAKLWIDEVELIYNRTYQALNSNIGSKSDE
jgi:hypothetical protein